MALSTRELLLILPPEKAAYAAGFTDGEGCIGIYQNGSYLRLSLQIAQKDRGVLEYLRGFLGGTITEVSWRSGSKGYHLCWYNAEAGAVLESLLPWLVLKKSQTRLAVEFVSLAGGVGVRLSAEARARRLEIAKAIRSLKVVA